MARRSRQSILKRQREQKRAEKADLKRRKREARRRGEVFVEEADVEPVGMVPGPAGLAAEEAVDVDSDAEAIAESADEPTPTPTADA